jgi:hypothetical protein
MEGGLRKYARKNKSDSQFLLKTFFKFAYKSTDFETDKKAALVTNEIFPKKEAQGSMNVAEVWSDKNM